MLGLSELSTWGLFFGFCLGRGQGEIPPIPFISRNKLLGVDRIILFALLNGLELAFITIYEAGIVECNHICAF